MKKKLSTVFFCLLLSVNARRRRSPKTTTRKKQNRRDQVSPKEARMHQQFDARIGNTGSTKCRYQGAVERPSRAVSILNGNVAGAPDGMQKPRTYGQPRDEQQRQQYRKPFWTRHDKRHQQQQASSRSAAESDAADKLQSFFWLLLNSIFF